jgi:hypothetical protein
MASLRKTTGCEASPDVRVARRMRLPHGKPFDLPNAQRLQRLSSRLGSFVSMRQGPSNTINAHTTSLSASHVSSLDATITIRLVHLP